MAKQATFQDKFFSVGDVVRVHLKLIEGGKERIQTFDGTVLAIKGRGNQKMVTVRKMATGGIGVERTVPLDSPWLVKIEVRHAAAGVRRAKLYNLRG